MAKSQSQRRPASRPRRRTRASGGEAARRLDALRALRGLKVLDTPPEEAFDGIVRIAARICAAPIAFISLADEHRHWFKARVGLETREMPRDHALAAAVPGMRFCAEAQLVTREGAAIGTLCVLDRKPRALRPDQAEALQALARQAVSEMELRASRDDFASRYRQALVTAATTPQADAGAGLRLDEQRLRLALDSARACVWDIDLRDRSVRLSEGWSAILQGPPGETRTTTDAMFALAHPDDLHAIRSGVTRTLKGETSDYAVEHRMRAADGSWRWILSHGQVTARDARGRAQRLTGVNLDITQRKRAELAVAEGEARFREFATASADSFWETDAELRMTWVSDSAAQVLGVPVDWVLGKTLDDLLPRGVDLDAEPYRSTLDKRRRREPFRDARYPVDLPSGRRWISSSAVPRLDATGRFAGYRGVTTDITERVELEQRAHATDQRLRAAIEKLDEMVALTDAEDRFVLTNEAFKAISPRHAQARPGQPWADFMRAELASGNVPEAVGREEQWLAVRSEQRRDPRGTVERQLADGKWLLIREQRLPDGGVITHGLDITARKRAEQALAESETRLRAIIDTEPECVKVLDAEGRLEEMNAAGLRMVEADNVEALLGQCVYGLIAAEYRDAFRDAIERVCRGAGDAHLEFRIVGLKGTQRWLEMHAVPLRDPASGKTRSLSVTRDITDRKRAEAALRERERELTLVMDGVPDMIARADRGERILFANRAFAELVERPRAEIVGRSVQDIVSADAYAQLKPHIERVLRGRPATYERTQQLSSGRAVVIEGRYIPDLDDEGRVVGWFALLRDVTEERRARSALHERERELRLIMDTVPVMITRADRDERLVFANRAYTELMERPAAELVGRSVREILSAESYAELKPYIDRVWAGEEVRFSRQQRRSDGSAIVLEGQILPDVDAKGSVIGWFAFFQNVTEERRSRGALAQSEARFRSLTRLSSDWYWEQDEEFRQSFLSDDYDALSGAPRAVTLGTRRWERANVTPLSCSWEQHRAQLEAHVPFRDFEYLRIAEDGRRVYVSLSGEPVFDESGAFRGYRGIGRNITDRKRAEQLLRVEHQVTRALAEADDAAAGVKAVLRAVCETEGWGCGRFFKLDPAANLLRFEDGWCLPQDAYRKFLEQSTALEFQPGQGLAGIVWQTREPVWSADTSRDPRVLGSKLAQNSSIRAAFAIPVHAENDFLGVLSFSGQEAREPDQRVLQAAGVIGSQIGQFLKRKRAEAELRGSRQMLENVIDAIPMSIFAKDIHSNYVMVNKHFVEFFGTTKEAMLKVHTSQLPTHDATRKQSLDDDRWVFQNRKTLVHETTVQRPDGTPVPYHSSKIPLFDGGKLIGLLGINRDISDEKRAQDALRDSEARLQRMNVELEERVSERTAELREAVKELDAFTYSVSHDLRAPVGAVNGFAHLLRTKENDRLSADGKHLLGVIEQNAERMIDLIEGLLRFARLGSSELRRVRLAMDELAGEALADFAEAAARAEVRVGALPECDGDRTLLGQVWANLIGNAFKYSRQRNPARIDIGWDAGKSAYFVRDNGIGFNMAYAEKLFGVFERLHHESEFEGSGIGLAIAERIVRRHGGRIWAEAADDAGATFWFTVPPAPAAARSLKDNA